MVVNSETVSKASRGHIEKFYDSSKLFSSNTLNSFGLLPEFDRSKALDSVRKDSTVMAALNTLVDKSLENGYTIFGVDGKSSESGNTKILDEKLRLKKLLRQVFYNLYAYGNVFVENVKDGNGKVKELHVLETTITQPLADVHGTIMGYQQVTIDNTSPITWNPDEVTHVALTKLTTGVWGELDIEAVFTSVLIKQYIYAYLGWLYGTNQFRGFYNIEEANEDQIKEFVSFLKRSQDNIDKPLIARGKINYQIPRDFEDGDKIINLLNKCDANILNLMQVPPIAIGLPGDSNRSNSDSQERSLKVRVRSVQDVVEESFRYDLFPKIGMDKMILEFKEPDNSDFPKLLEMAERMKNIGFKPSKIEEFLKNEGFPLKGVLIDTDLFSSGGKSDDMFASRARKQDGESNEKIGSGESGTTRDDQLVSKAFTGGTFNVYDGDL
jgi:hypothetical protein